MNRQFEWIQIAAEAAKMLLPGKQYLLIRITALSSLLVVTKQTLSYRRDCSQEDGRDKSDELV
jgi:hypothetical protein